MLYLSSPFDLSISTFVIAGKERNSEPCQADIVENKLQKIRNCDLECLRVDK